MAYADRLRRALSETEYKEGANKTIVPPSADKALLNFFTTVKDNRNTVYFVGNGGSAAIAMHMTSDYLKNGGLRTHSMLDPSVITCLANDFGFEHIFSKQLELIAKQDDVLVAISSSGKSPNILNAVKVAKKQGCRIVTFSGFDEDNSLRQKGDFNIYVPSHEYGIVETIHNMILQQIVDEIVARDGVGMK